MRWCHGRCSSTFTGSLLRAEATTRTVMGTGLSGMYFCDRKRLKHTTPLLQEQHLRTVTLRTEALWNIRD